MAPNGDPYRTLGLTRAATLAEVKQAYRRLAKANHPDAAGEAALPRFLAIQAAYDQIAGPGASGRAPGRPGGAAPPPWGADPDRADATRRAYGGRARRARTGGGGGRRPGSGTAGPRPGPSTPPSSDRPGRPPNKATMGSTSYDGAEAEPFEPDWGGASWYGTTSGTYWTLNPKEYADPRKHGPEYQARARRAAATARGDDGASAATIGDQPGPDPDRSTEPDPPTHTTTSWWDATAGPAADASVADEPAGAHDPDGAESTGRTGSTLTGRVGRAVLLWIPIALAIGWFGGEVTGCGRFAATCDFGQSILVWIAQVAVLALLVILAARRGPGPVS